MISRSYLLLAIALLILIVGGSILGGAHEGYTPTATEDAIAYYNQR